MKVHQLTVDQALASLASRPSGLTAAEALRRLAEFGPNRMEEVRGTPLILRFAGEFVHFFALILWVAAGLAFYAEAHQPGQGMGTMGIAIVGVIIINGLFSFFQEYRAERALSALRKLLPREVKALRDGATTALAIEALVPGDIVLLEEGDEVPADARVTEAHALRVNTATITGESLPRARSAEPSPEETALQAKNMLLAGTAIISGTAKALVVATARVSTATSAKPGRRARARQAKRTSFSSRSMALLRGAGPWVSTSLKMAALVSTTSTLRAFVPGWPSGSGRAPWSWAHLAGRPFVGSLLPTAGRAGSPAIVQNRRTLRGLPPHFTWHGPCVQRGR